MENMIQQGSKASVKTYLSLVQRCKKAKTLAECKIFQSHMMQSEFGSYTLLGNALVNMYAKYGSLLDARRVFDTMPQHDASSWMAIISAYAKGGQCEEALSLYCQMQQHAGMAPDSFLFVTVLKVCTTLSDIEQGRKVHFHITQSGLLSDVFVGSALIDMYSKCRSIQEARQVFNGMCEKSVVSWSAMILGYAQHGDGQEAIALFRQMQEQGVKPNYVTFLGVLKACASLKSLKLGKQVHAQIFKFGFQMNVPVANSLISMYAKCGSMEDACQVFNTMRTQDVVSWNAIITGYGQQGNYADVLLLFDQMQLRGAKPNNVTFTSLIRAYTNLGAMEHGKEIHALLIESGFKSDASVINALIGLYGKCGKIEDARQLFNEMLDRNLVSWNVMIAGYADLGYSNEACILFTQMQRRCMLPDKHTFANILKVCASLAALEKGKLVHAHLIRSGYALDLLLGNTLINMYGKCSSMEAAQKVFDRLPRRDAVSWTVLIAGYAHLSCYDVALTLFEQMQCEGMRPNHAIFGIILKICGSMAALERGKQVHAKVVESGYELDLSIGSILIDMYVKCRSIEDARQVFDTMHERNVVSWNAMIAGYSQQGQIDQALKLLQRMQEEGINADKITFVRILKACAMMEALDYGRQVHNCIIECGLEVDAYIGSTIVDMYAKCGSINDAYQVFDRMPERDAVSWTVMIAGYAQQGHGNEAFILFEQMQREGVKPDEVVFLCILAACSHSGLINEGLYYFESMIAHCIAPSLEHYTCIVDLLARVGCLDQAADFIHKMPIYPAAVIWMALLDACRRIGNVELGVIACQCVLKVQPEYAKAFVLLSNIYAAAGKWDNVGKLRKEMQDVGIVEGAWLQLD